MRSREHGGKSWWMYGKYIMVDRCKYIIVYDMVEAFVHIEYVQTRT